MARIGGERKFTWYICLALLTAALLSACGEEGGTAPPPATLVGADAAKLHDFITKQSPYTSWELWPGTARFYPGGSPHGALLTTYVNDIAAASIRSQGGMANGSIIIKENYMPDKTLAALTVMYRISGYNPAGGDWFWVDYTPAGAAEVSGQVLMCIGCHSFVMENEWMFTANECHEWRRRTSPRGRSLVS